MWDIPYRGALCLQGLDTLSEKLRAPQAEVVPVFSYLASARPVRGSHSQDTQNRSLELSGGLWDVRLGSVLQENFDFSSCSLLFSPSKGMGPACCRTFVCSVHLLHCPAPELRAVQRETEFSQRQLQPSVHARTGPCQIALRVQRRRKKLAPWLVFV